MTPRSPFLRSDAHPVKPGTSAALTARTIDATPPTTLALAQQAVSDITSPANFTAPSPALLYTLGFTFVMTWLAAQKLQIRASAVVASALMLVPLSSFHPAGSARDTEPQASYVANDGRIEQEAPVPDAGSPFSVEQAPDVTDSDSIAPAMPDGAADNAVLPPTPMVMPEVPDVPSPDLTPSVDIVPSPERIPALSPELMEKIRNSEALAQIEQQRVRLMLDRLNYRLRREAKKRQYRELRNLSF